MKSTMYIQDSRHHSGEQRLQDDTLNDAMEDVDESILQGLDKRLARRQAKLSSLRVRMQRVYAMARERNVTGLRRFGYYAAWIGRMVSPDKAVGEVAPVQVQLRRNFQELRKVRRLMLDLEQINKASREREVVAFSLQIDQQEQRIQFVFPFKPDKRVRTLLQRAGFIYRPALNLYERALDAESLMAADVLSKALQ